jgi:4,5-dihydroxyphthalate decarboxylase
MSIRLTIGFGDNPRIQPLKDGTVKPDSIELEFRESRNLFYHNLAIDDLDCSEMSISETILARERTDGTKWDWTAVPIFMSRAYGWTGILVNHTSGIETLADLKGKRVAVPDYDMTFALWMRCTLKDLYGIEASDITWYNIRTRGESHGLELALEKDSPPGIMLNWFTPGMDAATMLDRGELDAACIPMPPGGEGNPRIRKLLPDGGQAVIIEHYRKMGVLQTNHHVIVQNRIVQEHPWVPMELYNAFQRAKAVSYERARQHQSAYLYFPGTDFREQAAVFGEDPYPFGINMMRPMLDRLFQGSLEQGLIRKPITVEDVYHSTTLDT